jgi:hypothetical protein
MLSIYTYKKCLRGFLPAAAALFDVRESDSSRERASTLPTSPSLSASGSIEHACSDGRIDKTAQTDDSYSRFIPFSARLKLRCCLHGSLFLYRVIDRYC